ncbi:MAG TPA: hypothetical protein DCR32_01035 [Opitutae bacterium]|jgi:glycosidase|nr:hypothetical protein [Opitutae bacterium]
MKATLNIPALLLATASLAHAVGYLEVRAPNYNFRNAEYSTSHVFIDEIASTTADIEVLWDLSSYSNITDVEVFTNINRRDLARIDKNTDGYADGIHPVDGNSISDSAADTNTTTGHYYAPINMTDMDANSIWELTIPASKTGAYRLTARFKTSDSIAENSNDPNNWIWYGLRDHAVVVAPVDSRNVQLYVMNVFNVEADGDTFATRSTLEDLHDDTNAPHNFTDGGGNYTGSRWNLDYLKDLGMNWLWFQPIHPNGIDGREPVDGYGSGSALYEPGSPYAVKNFFAVNELMSANYDSNVTLEANRAAAMVAFQDFAAAADSKGVGIMLDAPFNHTAFDIELAQIGVDLFQRDGEAAWSTFDEIRNRDARFFSRDYNPSVVGGINPFVDGGENYGDRATSASDIAPGPDRFDFGKWNDVKDVYFGRYDALVEYNDDNGTEGSSHKSEGDWFDFTDAEWIVSDFTQNGASVNTTRRVWDYFAEYAVHWLNETRPTGQNRNSISSDGDDATRYAWDAKGIDGLRCDFGQGLPPQAWEYIINVARSHKWNFVMMSESLDGGEVTYRSSRHFEILNENIVFPLKSAGNAQDYKNIFEDRRNSYGQALVLANTTSHDEENYADPWQALVRNAAVGMMGSASLIFPGQELGIVTDNKGNDDANDNFNYGYEHYETNFGKTIPHFKRWNSMMPIWNDSDVGNDQLYPVYSGIQTARRNSPALRSSNRWFLDGDGFNNQIFAAAKYETANNSPATSDVVLAFSNLDRNNDQSDNFKLPTGLTPLLGLEDGRSYNVKNIAAYNTQDSSRRDVWLWPSNYTKTQIESNGFFVGLKKVPSVADDLGTPSFNEALDAWASAPYEAQYLKVYDVTPPPAPTQPTNSTGKSYVMGNAVTFTWAASPANTLDDNIISYKLVIKRNGTDETQFNQNVGNVTSYTYTGAYGDNLYAFVIPISVASIEGVASNSSPSVELIDPAGDLDGDGMNNADEATAGTDFNDNSSKLEVIENSINLSNKFTLSWYGVSSISYGVESKEDLTAISWDNEDTGIPGTNAVINWIDTETLDPESISKKFYRVIVE